MKTTIIAYYLPQYHPIPENDEWWGKGFTEWTSVGKAQPLFKGHYQPKVPADLGYYDLRLSEVREQQVSLAKEAGIDGFCYWHYWFGNGRQLLEMPFNEVLRSGKPDFPFCLGWANETWKAKVWDASAEQTDKVLIEQLYPGEADHINHFERIRDAFADKRYMRMDGRPIFLIYKPFDFKDVSDFMTLWNNLLAQSGIAKSFYFIANLQSNKDYEKAIAMGFDAVTYQPAARIKNAHNEKSSLYKCAIRVMQHLTKRPLLTFDYSKIVSDLFEERMDTLENVIPFLLPNWDHSPRSGRYGIVVENSTPKNFEKHAEQVLSAVEKKDNKLVFLKSWNEWGEGNYMEPDLRYGKGFIKALRNVVDRIVGANLK